MKHKKMKEYVKKIFEMDTSEQNKDKMLSELVSGLPIDLIKEITEEYSRLLKIKSLLNSNNDLIHFSIKNCDSYSRNQLEFFVSKQFPEISHLKNKFFFQSSEDSILNSIKLMPIDDIISKYGTFKIHGIYEDLTPQTKQEIKDKIEDYERKIAHVVI